MLSPSENPSVQIILKRVREGLRLTRLPEITPEMEAAVAPFLGINPFLPSDAKLNARYVEDSNGTFTQFSLGGTHLNSAPEEHYIKNPGNWAEVQDAWQAAWDFFIEHLSRQFPLRSEGIVNSTHHALRNTLGLPQ